mmetsp:Transcript_22555/g.58810  ORF Transcript_22555/g.58810 Transcript_22555/m.58810 type:complete len:276 (+) Transcript_22555:476-1303(+)
MLLWTCSAKRASRARSASVAPSVAPNDAMATTITSSPSGMGLLKASRSASTKHPVHSDRGSPCRRPAGILDHCRAPESHLSSAASIEEGSLHLHQFSKRGSARSSSLSTLAVAARRSSAALAEGSASLSPPGSPARAPTLGSGWSFSGGEEPTGLTPADFPDWAAPLAGEGLLVCGGPREGLGDGTLPTAPLSAKLRRLGAGLALGTGRPSGLARPGSGVGALNLTTEPMQNSHMRLAASALLCEAAEAAVASLPPICFSTPSPPGCRLWNSVTS